MNVKDGYLYTKEHEWAKTDGDTATVGLTDFAQHHLGDITYIEPVGLNKKVAQFALLTEIESVKAASEVFAPFSGSVIEFNHRLESTPELINQSPYEEGWIVKMKIDDTSEKSNLMDAPAYRDYLETLED